MKHFSDLGNCRRLNSAHEETLAMPISSLYQRGWVTVPFQMINHTQEALPLYIVLSLENHQYIPNEDTQILDTQHEP